MHHKTAEDGLGAIGHDAEQHTTEKRRNTFKQRFAEMDTAIKYRHGHDGVGTHIAHKRNDQEAAEEKFDGHEVKAVSCFGTTVYMAMHSGHAAR